MPKPPTQASIAKVLGVSRATVAEILGGTNASRYNDETQRRVQEAARVMGYRPNRQARLLAGVRSGVIGIIKTISTFQRNAELVLHAGEQIRQQGYEVISSDIFWHSDGLDRAVNALLDVRAEGIILAHQAGQIAKNQSIRRLIEAGMPIVSLGGDPLEGIPYVTPDYFQAGHDLAEHYLNRGYSRLSFAARNEALPEADSPYPIARAIHGFFSAAKAAGCEETRLETLSPRTPEPELPPDPVKQNIGQRVTRQLIECGEHENRGIAFSTDYQATAALQVCHELGVQVPEQVGVTGFDGGDNGALTWPPLTSVQHPTQELAQTAVDLLLEIIQGKVPLTPSGHSAPRIALPCQIIPRGSTRPILT